MSTDPARGTRAVLFDYGLTLVTFDFPTPCLLDMLQGLRPEIAAVSAQRAGGTIPSPAVLLRDVLERVETRLQQLAGEDEVDYLDFYGDAWRAAGFALPDDLLYRILDAEQRCWDGAVRVDSGMFHVLHRLRDRGLKTAICSNAPFPPEMMRRQVEGNGLGALMDAVVFSSEVGRRKPAPEPYLAALEALEVDPADALFVGDRVVEDYEGPRRVGMRAVLCTALAHAPAPAGIPAIGSPDELEAWL